MSNVVSKDEEALQLAQKHYQIEGGVTHIFRLTGEVGIENQPAEPIKLLEVNQNTVASGIMPIQFDAVPQSGIHYPSVIIEVTPEEYQQILKRELLLPRGWRIGYEIPKPNGA
jgi:hypothetical protein